MSYSAILFAISKGHKESEVKEPSAYFAHMAVHPYVELGYTVKGERYSEKLSTEEYNEFIASQICKAFNLPFKTKKS